MTERPASGRAGSGSELRLRIISALVLAALVLGVTIIGGWPFRLVWVLVAGFVAYEWFMIVSARYAVAGGAGVAIAAVALGLAPVSGPALAGSAALVALIGACLTPRCQDRYALEGCGTVYALCFGLVTPALRDLPTIGVALIIWTFAVVWLTDIAAYFTGRALGGPKLMPSVSPKKTWSGALGGTLAGGLGGLAVWHLSPLSASVSLPLAIMASFAASVFSQAGDLFESAIKRRFGAKDSSQLIPGHGGFLDRLDGYWSVLVFAGLVLFIVRLEF